MKNIEEGQGSSAGLSQDNIEDSSEYVTEDEDSEEEFGSQALFVPEGEKLLVNYNDSSEGIFLTQPLDSVGRDIQAVAKEGWYSNESTGSEHLLHHSHLSQGTSLSFVPILFHTILLIPLALCLLFNYLRILIMNL